MAWQASTFASVALAIAIPLGVLAGRGTWSLVAAGSGTYSPPVVPLLAVLAAVPVTLVAANLMAAGPGWLAARVPPARVLRVE